MQFDPRIIREIQLVQLGTLKRFDEVCRRHELTYWGMYGTLIGTARHQGFIPWDEDLDVGMMREDYEKLCEVPEEEWGSDYVFLHAKSDDTRHDVIFGRVYPKSSHVQCYRDVAQWKYWEKKGAWSTSLMLDVFIFDRVPDDEKLRLRMFKKSIRHGYYQKYRDVKIKAVLNMKSPKDLARSLMKRIYGQCMRIRYKKPWLHVWDSFDKMVKSHPRGRRIGTFSTDDSFVYDAEDYFPLATGKFEDMEIPIPKCWDRMLQDFYGDYMQYPPEDKRYHLDFVYLDLGDGRKYVFDPIPGSLGSVGQDQG